MPSRKLSDLLPHVQSHAYSWLHKCFERGIDVIVTCTYRSQEEQDELWERGRSKPGNKVTWTKKSKHTERVALDFTIVKDGKASWDVKADFDKDGIADYTEVGQAAEEEGFQWGIVVKGVHKDLCHIQWNKGEQVDD